MIEVWLATVQTPVLIEPEVIGVFESLRAAERGLEKRVGRELMLREDTARCEGETEAWLEDVPVAIDGHEEWWFLRVSKWTVWADAE